MTPPNLSQKEQTSEGQIELRKDSRSLPPMNVVATIIGILLLIIIIHIGFYNSYIKYFPAFKDVDIPGFKMMRFDAVKHFHGITMMAWVLMLLLQPILIASKKFTLHRRVGRLSYVLAPLVLLSIFLINQHAYHESLKDPGEFQAIAFLSLTFPPFVFFAVLYFLAIRYRHNTRLHMRFMASTAFLFIPPALDRVLIFYFNLPGYDVGSIIQLSVIAAVTIIDSIITKRLSPFILVLAFETLHKILWHSRETEIWQNIGSAIANMF